MKYYCVRALSLTMPILLINNLKSSNDLGGLKYKYDFGLKDFLVLIDILSFAYLVTLDYADK